MLAIFVPLWLNVMITVRLHDARPEFAGLGASIGLLAGFMVLFAILHTRRAHWLARG